LSAFLERYQGAAPLVFPKRLESEGDGVPRAVASPYDALVARNSRLRWAHAAFDTDTDGKVRAWREWLAYCSTEGLRRIAAVPLAMGVMPFPADDSRATAANAEPCAASGVPTAGAQRRLLLGPRLTGSGAHRLMPDASAVSASLLLDREVQRDDAQLFKGRTVFIGASHAGSGDLWLTPSGVYPGVELLANMVRFAPVGVDRTGWLPHAVHRVLALLLFGTFAWLNWNRRGQVSVLLATLIAISYLVVAVAGFDDFAAFDVLEAAILMMIVYKAIESLLDFGGILRKEWLQTPAGQRWYARVWQTVTAASRKPQEAVPKGEGHGDPPH
jgi:CHASE2 domain-containing sensor protein